MFHVILLCLSLILQLAAEELKKNHSAVHLGQRQSSEHNGLQRISSHGNINPMLARLSPATDQSRMAVSQPCMSFSSFETHCFFTVLHLDTDF